MYDTVIWATDGSEGAEVALDEALRLARLSGGELVAVHCDRRLSGRAAGWPALGDEAERRERIEEQVERLRSEEGLEVGLVVLRSQRQPADVVAEVAAERGADVVVCGTRGLGGISGAVVGSFTQRLLHVAPCPVLAVGPRGLQNATTRRAMRAETVQCGLS